MSTDTSPARMESDARLLRSVIERGIQDDPSEARTATDPDRVSNARRFLEGTMGVPFTEGNRIEVLKNGDEIFPSMLEAIGAARRTIDFLTFVYWSGEIGTRFAHLLAEQAAAGLRVRVLLDGWGSRPIDRRLIDEMKDAGADVRWFRPLQKLELSKMNHRTHRKLVIVDEEIGFTGGVGIADEWQGDARDANEWRDTHFRVTGPAISGLQAAFLDNWIETDVDFLRPGVDRFPAQPNRGNVTMQVVRGASESSWSDVSTLFLTLLQLARERLWITTAYFDPDGALLRQLCEAAKRGVDVRCLVPGPHGDKRFVRLAGEDAYKELLAGGVRIWEFQPSMLHAKIMTVDHVIACVGSANFNARSAELDEEVGLVVLDNDLVTTLDDHFEIDLGRSEEIDQARWKNRPLHRRLMEKVTKPFRHQV